MTSRYRRLINVMLALAAVPWSLLTLLVPRPAAAATVTSIVLNSRLVGNPHPIQSRWYSLRGYGAIRSDVNWPKRTEDCGGPFNGVADKIAPWQGGDLPGLTGNFMSLSGDCSDRYHDAGTATNGGAWVKGGGAQAAWSAPGNQTVNWEAPSPPEPPATTINLACAGLPTANSNPIWGRGTWDTSDQFYDSGPIGTVGGTVPGLMKQNYPATVKPPNAVELYSNGITLFRQNFTFTNTDWSIISNPAKLSQPSTQFRLEAVSDDWLRVYINGVQTNIMTTTAIANVNLDLKSIAGLLKPPPQVNTFALMVADKARFAVSDPGGRGAGICYNMVLSYQPPIIGLPGVVGNSSDVHAGGGRCNTNDPATGGQVTGHANAGSNGQYVVSAMSNISDFGSNGYNGGPGPADTLGVAGYAFVCRPDLVANATASLAAGSVPYQTISNDVDVGSLPGCADPPCVYVHNGGDLRLHGTLHSAATIVQQGVGNVIITGPIQLDNVNRPTRQQVSLGVIAPGDIIIKPNVTRVDAYLFADGTINTCDTAAGSCLTSTLVVNGFLMAKDILFYRAGPPNTNGRVTAEQVNFIPQIYLNPLKLFDNKVDSYTLEGQGERPPLF